MLMSMQSASSGNRNCGHKKVETTYATYGMDCGTCSGARVGTRLGSKIVRRTQENNARRGSQLILLKNAN